MRKTTAAGAVRFALFAAAGAAACAWAPQAAADDAVPTTDLGTQADVGGGQQWTVSGLQPTADSISAAPSGALWEATATATPVGGGTPIVPGFAARTPGGENYPVIWTVPTPLGINPSPLAAGESATGKLYFDVTGAAPDAVTYTRDGQDAAVWVQPPPAATAPAPATYGSGGASAYVPPVQAAPAPVAVPRVQAPVAPAAPAPAATGSSGTPAPAAAGATPAPASAGSAGTPQPATGSMGTPATPGAAATPAPASASTTPAPAASAPAAPAQANTAPAAGNTPAAGAPAPAAAPAPTPTAPLPSNGSSGTPFIVPTTTPVPVPAG